MNKGKINISIKNKVVTLSFYHPASNSFPSSLLKELAKTITEIGDYDEAKLIILKSEGNKSFCAGASFNELLAIKNLNQGIEFFSGFANLINAMRKCPKIIISRIQGKAVGGGVGIIAASDYCFATEKADLKLSELSIGIGPFVVAPAIERKIGISALSELSLNATEWHNAYWSKEKGLFSKVFETNKDMDNEIDLFCNNLTSYNPQALTELKKMLWKNTDDWDDLLLERAAVSGKLVLSEFTKESLQKFLKQ